MRKKFPHISCNRGGAAVEFAILVPIWLLFFFGILDYAWYLTNVMVMENAVAAGARAGVKVKYWLDPEDEGYQDPVGIARNAVRASFWLDTALKPVDVRFKGAGNTAVEDDEPRFYLEVKMIDYEYPPLPGICPKN